MLQLSCQIYERDGDPVTCTNGNPRDNAGTPRSRVWLDIDLRAIRSNYATVARHVHPCRVMAVMKANAYGLGVADIAMCLKDAGVSCFGVAEVREALAINGLGLPVHILGELLEEEVPAVVEHGIIAPIGTFAVAEQLNREALRQNTIATCHFLVDTGMGRLGIPCHDAEKVIRRTMNMKGLRCNGIYSHFPVAYDDRSFSLHQIRLFKELIGRLARSNIIFDTIHIANSDGVNNIDTSFTAPFNLVRTGINLYGAFDIRGHQALALEAALSLKTRLIAIRDLSAGSSIGYGQSCILKAPTRVGTISIGYADGLPLALSNSGKIQIRNCLCPILGRISMDYTTVDLSPCPEATVGDEATCLGGATTIADWAAAKGTISYDIICSIGNRVERRYL